MVDTEKAKEITDAIMEYWNKHPELTIKDIQAIIGQAFNQS